MIKGKFTTKNLLLFLSIFMFSQIIIFNSISDAFTPPGEDSLTGFTTSGTLTRDEVWGGKIHITGDVVVPKGVTLAIKTGTTISFSLCKSDYDVEIPVIPGLGKGRCNLIIKGNLMVRGDTNKKVIIGNGDTLNWGGIVFRGTNIDSVVEHAMIINADIGILCAGFSFVKLLGNEIVNNDVGIMISNFSSAKIKGNKIEDNNICGIVCEGYSRPRIAENIIKRNGMGILFENNSQPLVFDNELKDNFKDIQDNRENN